MTMLVNTYAQRAERLSARGTIARARGIRPALLRMRVSVCTLHTRALAREDGGGVTRVRRDIWMAEVKLHDQRQYGAPWMRRERIDVILSSSHNVIY